MQLDLKVFGLPNKKTFVDQKEWDQDDWDLVSKEDLI